jgi:molybdopterin/thiamine biosynthesis adenylyltransferase
MGARCSLLQCEGKVVTELKAVENLAGATAIPISAGGVDGAEGAITLVISGEDNQVKKAIAYVEDAKGAKISRQFRQTDCTKCNNQHCSLHGGNKHWLKNQ